jgi:hypothetical protein
LAAHPTHSPARAALAALAAAALLAALSACGLPFGIGLPSTRALETGVENSLDATKSFQITGSYTESGAQWSIDLQIVRPNKEHATVNGTNVKVEAIIIGNDGYFRGQKFLADHMGLDPLSQHLVKAAGNAWWTGSVGLAPQMPDLTEGSLFRSGFLGAVVRQRIDHVSVDGVNAVNLSGPRADVFVGAAPPYRLLRLHMMKGVAIDGIGEADFRYSNFNSNFAIAAPADVIDFSNLSTVPPIYTVVSLNTSGCGSPCVVSAVLKNLGGMTGAQAPSSVTFTETSAASGSILGTCHVQVTPDVGFNATTTVGCTIVPTGLLGNAANVTAMADNPGHA